MFLPPEILLGILEELKTDRSTLHNLRLVDKYFCQLATDILFGDFSIHYGFRHSVPQMKAIINYPGLQPYIRSLHLPSESFFPIARNFTLREGAIYRFPWSRDLSKEVNPPAQNNCYEQQTDSKNYRAYLEVPTNRNAKFSFQVKRYENEYNKYTKTLTEFLKKCVNLRAIHITNGLGFEAERSRAWCSMIKSDVFPILAESEVKRLDISVASGNCLSKIIGEYGLDAADRSGQLPVLSSITSLSIELGFEGYYDPISDAGRSKTLSCFISSMPKLASFSIKNTRQKQRQLEMLPTQCTQNNITSLTLGCMYFTEESLGSFRAAISSMLSLTSLTLDTIVLSSSADPQLDIYPERKLPRDIYPDPEPTDNPFCLFDPDSTGGLINPFAPTQLTSNFNFDLFLGEENLREIPTYAPNFSGPFGWKIIFDMFRERLPQLTEFSFKRLAYTTTRRLNETNVILFIPVQDREHYNRRDFQRFARGTRNMELISTLEGDYLALESLRNAVNQKRHKYGLAELKCESKSEGFGSMSFENETGHLSEEIPGFEHQTKNKRVILIPYDILWYDSRSYNPPGAFPPTEDENLHYWRIW
ncbi:hypothetical protein TWF506_011281 [Arthrobotrys conoides]|uniref:F-box domain-containing protein n=1 Tax=Arthrobotrys conoides TaxID=74498 RepID=A0AAN8N6L8_9PEZI